MNLPRDLDFKDLKAVFVDLDGTLVNSLPKLYDVYFEFLKYYGIKGSKKEFDEINGPSLSEVLTVLQARYQLPDPIPLLVRQYQSRIRRIYENDRIVMEGALETLTFLKSSNLKLFLVTSANQNFAELALHTLHLETVFDGIITGEMVQKGKPNPEIYLLALKTGHFMAKNVIAIEDSMHGVNAALNAGMYTLRLNKTIEGTVWHQSWAELESWNQIRAFFRGCNDGLSDD